MTSLKFALYLTCLCLWRKGKFGLLWMYLYPYKCLVIVDIIFNHYDKLLPLHSFISFLCLFSIQLQQLILNCPRLCVKRVALYQLLLVTMWHYDVSIKMVLQQWFSGTSKLWDRNQGSSLPSINMIKLAFLLMNSRTINASHWKEKRVQITWKFQICACQTLLLITV